MNSQLLLGGRKIEDTPQFRNALEQQQKIIREQYEKKLLDLEKERQIIEESLKNLVDTILIFSK